MADIVNTGATANDGSGDQLRAAFQQINQRFQQLLGTLSQIAWAPGITVTADPLRQWTVVAGQAYVAASNHVAGATFAADLAAGKWLAVDVAQLMSDLATTGAGKGAEMVAFKQSGTGAVDRTASNKMGETVSVKDFGAVGDGVASDSAAINEALAEIAALGGGTVRVPAGTYKLTSRLSIGANTTLLADDGVTYLRHYNGSLLANDLGITSTVTNYQGNGNIVIDGGTWEGNPLAFYDDFNAMAIGQGDNIKIRNCTFTNVIRAHAIDLSACRNVWIENNKFLGYSKYKHSPDGHGTSSDTLGQVSSSVTFTDAGDLVTTSGVNPGDGECIQFSAISGTTGISTNTWYFVVNTSGSTFQVSTTFGGPPIALSGNGTGTMLTWIRDYVEAVQLDHNVPGSFGFGASNGTPNINVFFNHNVVGPNPNLTNNTFTSYGAGIGSHGAVNNRYMQNVVVEGNTFIDCIFAAVRAWKWVGLTVSGNVFRGCNRCVHVTLTIWNQEAANNPDGTPSGQGQAGSDYTITGNTFETYSDAGVLFAQPNSFNVGEPPFYHKRVTITGNTFSNGLTNDAIDIHWVDGLTVTGNVFVNVNRVLYSQYVRNAVIAGNTAKDIINEFVFWQDASPSTGLAGGSADVVVSNNQAANVGRSGINVGTPITRFAITGNLLTGVSTEAPTRYGILVSSGASNGLISGNHIADGGATNKPVYGVEVTTSCSNITVAGNRAFGTSLPVSNRATGNSRTETYGTGSPEGVVFANVGSTYLRTDGGAGTTFYVKESGTGNTGWVAK